MKNKQTFRLVLIAIFAAFSFVIGYFTKIPIPGGYFTLLNVGIYATAMLLGKREGMIVGALTAFLNDFLSGYAVYMFFSLIIYGFQGYTVVLTKNRLFNYLISSFIMVGGYFIADMIIIRSLAVAFSNSFLNLIQATVGYCIALIANYSLRKANFFNGFS